ncbi:MAG: hypothetical protein AAF567_10760 [Actinomycetota bacterium]
MACTVGIATILGPAPSASAQDGGPTLELRVDGDRVLVDLVAVGEPVGALSLTLGGFDGVAEACSLVSGMGACNFAVDGLQIVGLNPTGWQGPAALIDVAVVDIAASGVWLRVNQATDVDGIDLAAQVVGSGPAPPAPTEVPIASTAGTDTAAAATTSVADEPGGFPWGLLLAGVGVVAVVAAGFVAAGRRSAPEGT